MHDKRLQILHNKEGHALNEIVDAVRDYLWVELEAEDRLHKALSCAILHSKEEYEDVREPIELVPLVEND